MPEDLGDLDVRKPNDNEEWLKILRFTLASLFNRSTSKLT